MMINKWSQKIEKDFLNFKRNPEKRKEDLMQEKSLSSITTKIEFHNRLLQFCCSNSASKDQVMYK